MECSYGCGKEGKYKLKNGKRCCEKSSNSCPINKNKNKASNKLAHKNNPEKWKGHTAWNKGLTKETNEIIKNQSIEKKERFKNGNLIPPYRYIVWTKEKREKIGKFFSVVQKNRYERGIPPKGGYSKHYFYGNLLVHGTYELRTCFILDKLKKLEKIQDWEYTKDRFKYIGKDKKEHFYLMDFKIFKNNNTFFYLEIKGFLKDNDLLKWKAVKKQGYKLKIWYKKHIIRLEKILNLSFNEKNYL